MPRLLPLVLAVVLAGCGTTGTERFATEGVRAVSPEQAVEGPEVFAGETVIWGGKIAGVENRTDTTAVEILFYPLNDSHEPRPKAEPGRRFIAVHPGFLEPANYERGRFITVTGKLDGVREGRVGERPYTYPVVRVADHELWPRPPQPREQASPRVRFGIGIIFD